MKALHYYIAIAIATVISSCTGHVFRVADYHYNSYEFAEAARKYEHALATDSTNTGAMLHLADCYRRMNRYAQAEVWYRKSCSSSLATPEDYLHYGEVLKSLGKYSEASVWFAKYIAVNPSNYAVQDMKKSCDDSVTAMRSTPFFRIQQLNVNSYGSVFSSAIYAGQLIVAAETDAQGKHAISNWNGNGFLDMFTLDINQPGELIPLTGINTDLNEGPGVISSDGRYLYFTRNSRSMHKPQRAADKHNHLELCVAEKNASGQWDNIKALPFNSSEYSCGHPAITKDGSRLFFVSDMPGGLGGTDIYYSDYKEGKWTTPVNAGLCINTEGDEMFPTINTVHFGHEEIYYSTDGLPGLGGLDIYYSVIENGACSKGRRLDVPFNSSADDFGVVYEPGGNSGFFSSNRSSLTGVDHLFRFERIPTKFYMEAKVMDKSTGLPVTGAPVSVRNSITGISKYYSTDENGKVFFEADSTTSYAFTVRKEGYFVGFTNVLSNGFHGQFYDTTRAVMTIDKIVINKPIRLENIYYDYNKWDIRPDAAVELDKLVKILLDNPAINIELSSHTDCRGGDDFNLKLSQKRAESAVAYIVSKGISKSRITAKGYGETKLLNKCDDNVECTEEEHQWNRRTEFKVTHFAYPDTQTP